MSVRISECKSGKKTTQKTERFCSIFLLNWALLFGKGHCMVWSSRAKEGVLYLNRIVVLKLALNPAKSQDCELFVSPGFEGTGNTVWMTHPEHIVNLAERRTHADLPPPFFFFKCNRLSFLTSVLLFTLELLMSTESLKKQKAFF